MTNDMMVTTSRRRATGLRDGAVIEIDRDGEAMTALVLLAGDEMVILDACDDSTPFVVRYDELGSFRVFEPDLLGLAA